MNARPRTRPRTLLPLLFAAAVVVASAGGAAAAPAPAPAPKPAPARATAAPAKPKILSLPTRRPLVLDVLHVEGKTDAPRVLFVHAGPNVALEDAPTHPSYLRDDFTAALSSPVRVRVRTGTPLRPSPAGGNR